MQFHLVDISPWPFLVSFTLFNFAIGLLSYLHGYDNILYQAALLLLIVISYAWWRDVVRESTYQGNHTLQVVKAIKMGVILFIVSEVMLFFSFFWALLHSSLSPSIELGSSWPPLGITPLDKYSVPLLNTILLLSSGAAVTYTHHNIVNGNKDITGLNITIVLAIIFTALQYLEYSSNSFNITDSVYGTTFYCLTGLHGLHVIVGTIFLIITKLRINHITKNHHMGFLAASWYWHFVDVVWIIVYVIVY